MPTRPQRDRPPADSLWERAEPGARPAPAPLSRDRIVSAASAIADADGLGSVSLRKVGAALDVGPMRIYGYVATKEELLELMVDAVYAEMMAEGPFAGEWRGAMRAMADRMRFAARRHEWFVDLLGGRPHQGPGALAHLEASLAAFDGQRGFGDIDAVMRAFRTIGAYVIGAIRNEAAERRAQRETGMDKVQWQSATSGYIQRIIATGRFPNVERVVHAHAHPSADEMFAQGLDCVLDGIAASL